MCMSTTEQRILTNVTETNTTNNVDKEVDKGLAQTTQTCAL